MRILLAEDNHVNQKVATTLLRNSGANVDVAIDGIVAVELAMRQDSGAILMDCRMPETDGMEAARRIREPLPSAHRLRR